MRNLLGKVPKSAHGIIAPLVRSLFEQPAAEAVWAQHARFVEQLDGRCDEAADMLAEAELAILTFRCPRCWRAGTASTT